MEKGSGSMTFASGPKTAVLTTPSSENSNSTARRRMLTSPSSENSKSMARRRMLSKNNKQHEDFIESSDDEDNVPVSKMVLNFTQDDVAVESSDDDDLPVSSMTKKKNTTPSKSSTKKCTPTKSLESFSKSAIRKSLLYSNSKTNISETNNESNMKSLARKSKLNEPSTKKGRATKKNHIDKNQQTLTQLDKKGKLKPKSNKVAECAYDIKCCKKLPYKEIKRRNKDVDDESPLEIVNARKGNGWKLELLLTYTNGWADWVFIKGVWDELPNETEAFMSAVGINFKLCGYDTDPRVDPKISSDYDDFGSERDIDFEKVTFRIHKK